MPRSCVLLSMLLLMTQCGCAVQDWVFAAFSDSYSAGGVSTYEKQEPFQSRDGSSQEPSEETVQKSCQTFPGTESAVTTATYL